MSPCEPIDIGNIHTPSVRVPGLVPSLPSFDFPFPSLPIENLDDLFQKLAAYLPTGIQQPHLSLGPDKNVLDAIKDLLRFLNIFLIPLKLIIPILEMILCIIEILCALMHPFKLVKAMIRLFRVCIPALLSLFPIFALILFIISLLLLILALILYLIERIIAFIKQILANILLLAHALNSADDDSIIAITIKLGDLLCLFQGLFVILGIILLIIQVITQLLQLKFRIPPCDTSNSEDSCCSPDVCPSFIRNNTNIFRTTGTLQYFNDVIQTGVPLGIDTLRPISYQFFDGQTPLELAFNNITHAFDIPDGYTVPVFFPTDGTYTAGTPPTQAPYTVDLRLFYDPVFFGRTDDQKGKRFIRIKDCIVLQAPIDGVSDFENVLIAPFNGTVSLGGGTAFEDDGKTIMKVHPTDTPAGTLNTVITLPTVFGIAPVLLPTDGLTFLNVEYTFKINHFVLVAKQLISLGCHPDVAFNKEFLAATLAAKHNANTTAFEHITLPDVSNTQQCINNAIIQYRQSVSIESTNALQTTVLNCLQTLQNQTEKTLGDVITAGFDPFNSDFIVDPTIQFTTKFIDVIVSLNESSGTLMPNKIPANVAQILAGQLQAVVSLGNVSAFSYDGVSKFIAQISSTDAGNGTVRVAFNNQFISTLTNLSDVTQTPSVDIKELPYTFVQSAVIQVGEVARDEGDVARDGGN